MLWNFALAKGMRIWYPAGRMKKFCEVACLGIGALFALSACKSTDADGYSSEAALPMSEVADGEIPPWLLEDDGTNGGQVGAGSRTPEIASRNDYAIPEPTSAPASVGSTRQNQPKLAESGQDAPVVESVGAGTSSFDTPHPADAGLTPTDTSAGKTSVGSGKKTSSSSKKKMAAAKKPKRPTMIVYKVRPGDNLTLIAKRSGTTVAQIRKDSGIKGDVIHPGQVIKVRYTPKGYKAEKSSSKKKGSSSSKGRTHTVTSGQTLSGIAAKYGVGLSSLMKANGISASQATKIRPGRKLIIPAKR